MHRQHLPTIGAGHVGNYTAFLQAVMLTTRIGKPVSATTLADTPRYQS